MSMAPEQLRVLLIDQVRAARLGRGDAMPSIRAISRAHEVSKAIAERAIRSLVADGICYAEQGRGVFLAVSSDVELESRLVAIKTIAVVFGYLEYPATDHHFYRQVYEGIQEWIVGNRCNVLKLYSWRQKAASQKDAELARFAGGIDGLIALGLYSDEDCMRLRNTGLPLAVVDYEAESLGIDCAIMDDCDTLEQLAARTFEAAPGELFFLHVKHESGEDPSHGARLRIVERVAKQAGRASVKVIALDADDTSRDTQELEVVRTEIAAGTARPAVIFDDEHLVARVAAELSSGDAEAMRDYVLAYLGPQEVPAELEKVPALIAGFDFRELGRAGGQLLEMRMQQGAGRPVKRAIRGEVRELAKRTGGTG
jgi:DNA-binding LacI/PurR family transcriptional regulator